jgi:hypothetical protein
MEEKGERGGGGGGGGKGLKGPFFPSCSSFIVIVFLPSSLPSCGVYPSFFSVPLLHFLLAVLISLLPSLFPFFHVTPLRSVETGRTEEMTEGRTNEQTKGRVEGKKERRKGRKEGLDL